MKIAMIGQKGIPTKFGGIERHVEAISTRLGLAGNNIIVYNRAWYSKSKTKFGPGVTVITTPTIHSKNLDAIVHTFTSTLDAMRRGVDVIHYHGVGPSLLAWLPRIFAPKIKIVSTFHCIDKYHHKWGWFGRLALGLGERASCKFAHETIILSKTLQSYCYNRYNKLPVYIPNGVDLPSTNSKNILARFGLKKNNYILMVARLVPNKGVHHLITAYNRLTKKGVTLGKKLVIVGGSAFTDEYVASLKLAAKINPGIVFTGTQSPSNVHALFAGAYALVHPSEWEGAPLVVLEAMSHGKTVLASDIPEITEITRGYGLNFKNKSVDDLERKLNYILKHPEEVRVLGRLAKNFVLKHYRWDDAAKAIAKIYKILLAPKVKTKSVLATAR